MSTPTADVQLLAPSALLEFFVLDATALGGSVSRFHAGVNGMGGSVVWQGNTYDPFPIQSEGFDMTSKGVMPRPTIRVSNVGGVLGSLVAAHEDFVGATLTRKRTLAKFLDAVNFPGGVNPTADPAAAFPDDVYYVERKTTETAELLEFELAASSDLQGMLIPRRIVQASCCMWNDAAVCTYSTGGQCTKTLDACKGHWGATADLPYGGFPGAGRV